ncbi:vitamin B12 dependent methionine synthase, activation domain protein [Candidatus Vecturithrix granuli]|uniref:Vitamin B12 dependent methionine synthase, activation domain protein n=1 Tax=Vecturithrix granuli TaxID=1499967 RepID=A0A081BUW3_VECG1|nr:vitamin B12 dependent methionine synthase, activation domain protein [Candidatus Vecturithrix granuli]
MQVENSMEILQSIPMNIDIHAVLAASRIKTESRDGKIIQELIESVQPAIQPKAVYRLCYIDSRQENTITFGGVHFTSRVMQVNLEQTERVFPFIVTAGRELEEATRNTTDMLHQYALDVLKETVLRQALEYVQTHLKETYNLQKISMMNPGSLTDWPITEQPKLFSLFGDVKQLIGVELTESYLMYPVKSVSGLIFPTEVSFVNCQLCPRENCPGRRAPYDEMLLHMKY